MTSDTSNTPYHEKEISADTYAALTRHQFNLESLGQRFQRIENTTVAMKDKWNRGDEAMRDFTGHKIKDPSRRLPSVSTDVNKSTSIDTDSPASTDNNILELFDIYSGLDEFWQVVKEEKLQEGDFKVESLMSFGGSHWCRSTPTTEHRSTYTHQDRSIGVPEHRSTTPTESTMSCNAVKILSHEEFAAKHPHPPSPDNVRIVRHANSNVDRHSKANIDRQPSPPIDQHAPITCRVQMPKIDVARLNALRPKPKPSEQPPEPVRTPSVDGDDPMEEDRVSTGRTLRRRKEKQARHLKRGANEKEKENFQKRVIRIPLHIPFEEAYYSHRLWMSFRETREKE
ncbi:hypothetical protein DY000_02015950 [Brassica cretica]|uniref:Uncharacterized protein n=1 Tax=Brassica cretica TaxID=69181 RepID=A0ABQ7CTW5_BRACR|nr:hypothetical protein DY000_02015950 [Brassica cretica]